MSEFVEVKTQYLEFGALDWCIAQIEKLNVELTPPNYGNGTALVFIAGADQLYRPSTEWEAGGHLIGKYKVNLHSQQHSDDCWAAWITIRGRDFPKGAYQPLQAACRAIVASVLGETVSVPKELLS